MYKAIEIDRKRLTIMGVKFSDIKTLDSSASAIGLNMFEGFEPTPKGIVLIRDLGYQGKSLTPIIYSNSLN